MDARKHITVEVLNQLLSKVELGDPRMKLFRQAPEDFAFVPWAARHFAEEPTPIAFSKVHEALMSFLERGRYAMDFDVAKDNGGGGYRYEGAEEFIKKIDKFDSVWHDALHHANYEFVGCLHAKIVEAMEVKAQVGSDSLFETFLMDVGRQMFGESFFMETPPCPKGVHAKSPVPTTPAPKTANPYEKYGTLCGEDSVRAVVVGLILSSAPGVTIGFYAKSLSVCDLFAHSLQHVLGLLGVSSRFNRTGKVLTVQGPGGHGTIIFKSLDNPSSFIGYETGHAVVTGLDNFDEAHGVLAVGRAWGRNRQQLAASKNAMFVCMETVV